MTPAFIVVELLSAAAFSRGEPTASEVDIEVEHDELGLPRLGGKTLHGLFRDAWLSMAPHFPALRPSAARVLGAAGRHDEGCILRIGDAVVDDDTRQWVSHAGRRRHDPVAPSDVLRALTEICWQTAEDRETGAPARASLRAVRVVTRGLTLYAPCSWLATPTDDDTRLLAMCVLATRHAGLGRHRGRGHVRLSLDGDVAATRRLAQGFAP